MLSPVSNRPSSFWNPNLHSNKKAPAKEENTMNTQQPQEEQQTQQRRTPSPKRQVVQQQPTIDTETLLHHLQNELEETTAHRDAIASDTRKWGSLSRTIEDICELSAKLNRDKEVLLEELAVKRRNVQLLVRERDAMKSELEAIENTIGRMGKFG